MVQKEHVKIFGQIERTG